MKKMMITLLVLALAVSGIMNASLAAKNEGLCLQLEESVADMARAETKWTAYREKAEAERLELIRQIRLAQMENDALAMENSNLRSQFSRTSEEALPLTIDSALQAEKIKME